MKYYELHLPVFKQGDDLAHSIEQCPGRLNEAFEHQASMYDEAARLCRRMAGVAAEMPELTVEPCTHFIGVDGQPDRLESLVHEGILCVMEHEDDEDDDDDIDDEDDEPDEDDEDEVVTRP